MSISKKFYSLVVAGLLAFSSASHATNTPGHTTVYDFGKLLTASDGYAAPNSFADAPFAQLAATDTGLGVWSFLLTINNNLFSSFGPDAFLKVLSFDFSPNPTAEPVSLITTTSGEGVSVVTTVNGTGGSSSGVDFDFGTRFGSSGNKLTGNESVQWTVSGLAADSRLNQMIFHVQGITGGYSAKYTPIVSPVPEPETYAMLLAGLGLIGFSIRRRKQSK